MNLISGIECLQSQSDGTKEWMISSLRRDSLKCTELVHQRTGTVTSTTIRKLQIQEAMAGWRSTWPVAGGQMWPQLCWLHSCTVPAGTTAADRHLARFWMPVPARASESRSEPPPEPHLQGVWEVQIFPNYPVSAMKEVILEGGCNRMLGVQILNFSRTAC